MINWEGGIEICRNLSIVDIWYKMEWWIRGYSVNP